jgi:hemoglobin
MKRFDIASRGDVEAVIDQFYETASRDELLGPIFSHLDRLYKERLYDYWANTLLDKQSNLQRSFPRHIASMFSHQHFVRWVRLFIETMDRLYAGPNVEKAKVIVIRKSEEYQTSLELLMF